MACVVHDGAHSGFVGGSRLSSLKKALTCGLGTPHSPRSDRSGKHAKRLPTILSSSSGVSTCVGSDDSEVGTPTAAASIDRILQDLAVEPWHAERFDQISRLQEAFRNQGSVELMYDKACFGNVAVKKMPNRWMQTSAAAFATASGGESEQPWFDLAVVQWLNAKQFPYSCAFHGIFQDETMTYVVFELATEGDLMHWCQTITQQGDAREKAIRPVTQKLCSAVAWLHDLGIAHGDISLENVLLTKSVREEDLKVMLIDFGMSTTQRRLVNKDWGKPMYQAPEMHVHDIPYDPFLVDVFAVGVTLFALAAQDYPWMSTVPGRCEFWNLMAMRGLRALLGRKRLRRGKRGEFLSDVLSPNFVELLEGMLAMKPGCRLTLGELAWSNGFSKKSVWNMQWMKNYAV